LRERIQRKAKQQQASCATGYARSQQRLRVVWQKKKGVKRQNGSAVWYEAEIIGNGGIYGNSKRQRVRAAQGVRE